MQVVTTDLASAHAVVDLSHDEMRMLANALNEVLHGLAINEFGTRMGVSKEEAKELLGSLRALLAHYPGPSW